MSYIAEYRVPLLAIALAAGVWILILRIQGIKPWTPEAEAFRNSTAGFFTHWALMSVVWFGLMYHMLETLGTRGEAHSTDALTMGVFTGFLFAVGWRVLGKLSSEDRR